MGGLHASVLEVNNHVYFLQAEPGQLTDNHGKWCFCDNLIKHILSKPLHNQYYHDPHLMGGGRAQGAAPTCDVLGAAPACDVLGAALTCDVLGAAPTCGVSGAALSPNMWRFRCGPTCDVLVAAPTCDVLGTSPTCTRSKDPPPPLFWQLARS